MKRTLLTLFHFLILGPLFGQGPPCPNPPCGPPPGGGQPGCLPPPCVPVGPEEIFFILIGAGIVLALIKSKTQNFYEES